MNRIYILLFSLFLSLNISAQQTVGVFLNDSLSYNGYTLFNATNSRTAYLIDNCGFVVNSWESEYNPGMSLYLLKNGDLLRTARVSSGFNAGGTGGRIELFNWEGDLLWAYNHSTPDYHQHHDIEPLDNGNFLVIAWELYSRQEAVEAGRNPDQLSNAGLWSEHIMELQPLGTDSAAIIWEWHAWDHLVQEHDSTKANYGVVADHPELFDLNFTPAGSSGRDWLHFNSIDYNPALDQILVSSRHWSEFFIIDRSTTSEEAASHEGGLYGKGGDILYRWGNPQSYQRGDQFSQKTFGQHDVHWVEAGLEGAGQILFYNNGSGRPAGSFSTVEAIEVPETAPGTYYLEADSTYGPASAEWTYIASNPSNFYSPRISGAQRLPNGNTLICEGTEGRFFEVDMNGNFHWEYISPVTGQGPVSQGQTIGGGNDVFRAERYSPDYPAFVDRMLEPGLPVELDPWDLDCEIHELTTSVVAVPVPVNVVVFPNPVSEHLVINWGSGEELHLEVFDLLGRKINERVLYGGGGVLNLSDWKDGIYLLGLNKSVWKKIVVKRE